MPASKRSPTAAVMADWARIDAMGDEDIDCSDIPDLGEAAF
jgi:hypothetical protein